LDKALPDTPNNTANMTAPLFMALPFTAVLANDDNFFFRLARPPRRGDPDQDDSERDQHPILSRDAENHKLPNEPVTH
jgi:hypothetical protein